MPGLLLGAAIAVVAFVLVLQSDVGPARVVRGAPAPDFELARLGARPGPAAGDGEGGDPVGADRVALSDLRGRVVLVNFWASWCEPCEREMPAMERLYQSLPRDEFELLAVAIDDEPAEVRAFQDRMQLSFPILLDPQGRVSGVYQTMGVPESLLIDREGRVVERYVGPREWDEPAYASRIRALVQGGDGPGTTGGPG